MKIRKIYQQEKNKAWLDLSDDKRGLILSFEHDGVEFCIEFDSDEAAEFLGDFQYFKEIMGGEE